MRRVFALIISFILAFLVCIPAFAVETAGNTYYVDSVNGDDTASGNTPDNAWKTIDRVNQSSFSQGDKILFHKGQSFTGTILMYSSGSKESPIVISSYGEGDNPHFVGKSQSAVILAMSAQNLIVENLEISDSDGMAIGIIAAQGKDCKNITIRNCYIHDIAMDNSNNGCSAIYINNDLSGAKTKEIHLDSLRIENVSWGVHCKGTNVESNSEYYISPEESYSTDFDFENIYIKNAKRAGFVIACVYGCHVHNCRILDCATAQDSAYAPIWIRHSKNVLIEYCEVAGSTNKTDGMTVDFDGWTTDSTYRYIYSHDNVRFIKSCVFDNETNNRNNEVYNCVSVNDNQKMNWSAISLISTSRPDFAVMKNFSFHDNVMINSSPILWIRTPFPKVSNVTFCGSVISNVINGFFNLFSFSNGFKYETDTDVSGLIEEITKNLPTY